MAEEHIDLIGGHQAEVEVIENEDEITTIIDYSKTDAQVHRMTKFQLGEGTMTRLDDVTSMDGEVNVPIAMLSICEMDRTNPRELICVVDPDAVMHALQDTLVLVLDDVRKAQLALRFVQLLIDPEHAEALSTLMDRLDDDGWAFVPPGIPKENIFYVTFGVQFRDEVHPQGMDPDGYVVIIAPDVERARETAFSIFGTAWAFMYDALDTERARWNPDAHPKGVLGIFYAQYREASP